MSNINYLSINENFPVAGEDNDTQVFRDNFDTIKTSLREAKTEITTLEDNVARVDFAENDFNSNKIVRPVLHRSQLSAANRGTPASSSIEIDFEQAHYHILNITSNTSVQFTNFPVASTGVGKVTVELYKSGSGADPTITFISSGGSVIKRNSSFPGTLTLDSTSDPIIFEAWRHSADTIFLNYLGKFS